MYVLNLSTNIFTIKDKLVELILIDINYFLNIINLYIKSKNIIINNIFSYL